MPAHGLTRLAALSCLAAALADADAPAADTGAALEELVVVGIAPSEGPGRNPDQMARHIRSITDRELATAQSLDLTGYLRRHVPSVSANSAQGNPLQVDLLYRGYTASPLLGLPQGLAVYVDGARLNEPLGDTVNWDLIPQSAVHRLDLISGAYPLFGLNSLGGAVALQTKHGFNFTGHAAEISGGSHGRTVWTLESGGNDGAWGYYVNWSRFDESGWRDLSPSRADNRSLALGWRGEDGEVDLALHHADTALTGNGTAPVGLLARDRKAIFTAPDRTANDHFMLTLEGRHRAAAGFTISWSAYHRDSDTRSLNGDVAGSDDFGDVGSGAEAANNRSEREQQSRGFDAAVELTGERLGLDHLLLLGVRHQRGDADFDASVELADLDPITRSTRGLGTGTLLPDAATDVAAQIRGWSVYALDTITVDEAVTLTLAGRFDTTEVRIRDRSGRRPELDGDHRFQRFNPAIGVTWQLHESLNVYAGAARSSRAPTPVELTCNESVFAMARELAAERGEDPAAVDFECRLPNAFVADPPLDQVVTTSFEAGARGRLGRLSWHAGAFRQSNRDDIVFQTTGRATGLFGAIDRTRRQGLELSVRGNWARASAFVAYTAMRATFEDDFLAQSPAHPGADAAGRIAVSRGDEIPGIPRHQLKVGAQWRLGRVTVAADAEHFAGSHLRGDETNALARTDDFTVVGLRASVDLGRLRLFGRIDNLFDASYEDFGLIGEDPGEVIPGLRDRRPLFLAPGAPRAGWIGLRLKLGG